MRFYFPEFLFGLFLIAIPVIIHLFNFRKFKKVKFSNTSFLKEIQIQTSSRQKIKERLILLSRILAITFLVIAFAKPYFPAQNQNDVSVNNTVSIYVDNSYSMEAINKEGSLLEEGKRKATEIASTFELNDKFQLLTNDLSGEQNSLLNKEEFLETLAAIKISPVEGSYQKVIDAQTRFLKDKNHTNKKAFLLSDFQKYHDKNIRLDSAIQFHLIALKSNDMPNLAIDSVWFLSPLHQPKAQEKLCIKIQNYSDKELNNVNLTLKLNDKIKAIGSVNLKPNSSNTDTLIFSGLDAGWHKGEISIQDYPIIFDDRLYFSFEVKNSLAVTIINEEVKNNYFTAAFSTDPFFKVSNISKSQINYTNLKIQQLMVLNELKTVSDGLAQQLKQFVINGGNLSVYLPLDADLIAYKSFLQGLNADYPLQLVKDTIQSTQLNLTHPVFENMFETVPRNIDLPKAYQYFRFSQQTRTSKQSLIYGQGNSAILSAYKVGKGNFYLSAIPLASEISNFANHGLFLPILFKMALISNNEEALFYEIGKSEGFVFNNLEVAESDILKLTAKELEIIPEVRNTSAGTTLFFADQVKKAGFYDLYQEKNLLSVLAFNENRQESRMEFYNNNELAEKFGLKPAQIINAGTAPIQNQIKEVKLGTSLWKLCLILVLIFLAAEIILIRFFRIQTSKPANN